MFIYIANMYTGSNDNYVNLALIAPIPLILRA